MLANVALPSFLPHSFLTLIGIFVIAALEGWFVMRALNLSYSDSYRLSLWANLRSTVAGIPLAWLLWLAGLIPVSMGLSALGVDSHPAVQSTLMQSVLFGGMMPTEWTNVASAAAWLLMLVPFWFGSVWIERRTILKRLPDRDPSRVSSAVIRGNLASYTMFLIMGAVGFMSALDDLPNQKARFERHRERQKQYRGEQDGARQPTTALDSKSEGDDKPKPDPEGRSQ